MGDFALPPSGSLFGPRFQCPEEHLPEALPLLALLQQVVEVAVRFQVADLLLPPAPGSGAALCRGLRRYTKDEVVALAVSLMNEAGLLRAMSDVKYFPSETPAPVTLAGNIEHPGLRGGTRYVWSRYFLGALRRPRSLTAAGCLGGGAAPPSTHYVTRAVLAG
jgi:hypothetical protein